VLLEQDAESGWIVQRCAEHLAIRVDLTHHLVLVTRRVASQGISRGMSIQRTDLPHAHGFELHSRNAHQ
jgi:hypothetical protein